MVRKEKLLGNRGVTGWAAGLIVAGRAMIIVAGSWDLVGSGNAQLQRDPSHDSVLSIASIERERMRPDQKPGLNPPFVPGTQTIVLQEYEPSIPPEQRMAPIALHIPDEFFYETTGQVRDVWGINLQVQFPSMRPLRTIRPARKSWEGDEIPLHISINRKPDAVSRVEEVRRRMAMESHKETPLAWYKPRNVPTGYSEALTVTYPKLLPSSEEWDFIAKGEGGEVKEFAQCSPLVRNPSCAFFVTLPGDSRINIQFVANMKYWDDRQAVAEKVEDLVKSFLTDSDHKQQ
jgi:hypothetical protein